MGDELCRPREVVGLLKIISTLKIIDRNVVFALLGARDIKRVDPSAHMKMLELESKSIFISTGYLAPMAKHDQINQ